MTGIAGLAGAGAGDQAGLLAAIRKLQHRGAEEWLQDDNNGLALAIRGDNPAESVFECRRTGAVILLDGQPDHLKKHMAILAAAGTDTRALSCAEIVLRLYQHYGTEQMMLRVRGAYAAVIYDTLSGTVTLLRGSGGGRSLYYAITAAGGICFASEIKAVLEFEGIEASPDMTAVDLYLTCGHIPAPRTIFAGISAVEAGGFLTWMADEAPRPIKPVDEKTRKMPPLSTFNTIIDQSVVTHMPASGTNWAMVLTPSPAGLLLATAARRQPTSGDGRIAAYTISFKKEDNAQNTATGVEAIAAQLKVDLRPLTFTPGDFAELPEIVWLLEQPFADSDILLKWRLLRYAAGQCQTILMDEGDDHLNGLGTAAAAVEAAFRLPKAVFTALGRMIPSLPQRWLMRLPFFTPTFVGKSGRRRLAQFVKAVGSSSIYKSYHAAGSLFTPEEKKILFEKEYRHFINTEDIIADSLRRPAGFMRSALRGIDRSVDRGTARADIIGRMSAFTGVACHMPFQNFSFRLFHDALAAAGMVTRRQLVMGYINRALGLLRAGRLIRQLRPAPFPFKYLATTHTFNSLLESCLSADSLGRRGLFSPQVVAGIEKRARAGDPLCGRQILALLTLELWFRIYIDREKGWVL